MGRPHRIVSVSAAALSLVWRRLAPVGASSRALSPSAKEPWQSAHPAVFQASRPAFTLESSWARAAVAYVAKAAARMRAARQLFMWALMWASEFEIAFGFTC